MYFRATLDKMNALAWEDKVSLVFATVLDQMSLGLVDEDEEQEVADRAYWEKRGTEATLVMADRLLELIHGFDSSLEMKYKKLYIGLAKNGQPNNFALFRPQKSALRLEVRVQKSAELERGFEDAGLDLIDYTKWGRYVIRLTKGDVEDHAEFLADLLKRAYLEAFGG